MDLDSSIIPTFDRPLTSNIENSKIQEYVLYSYNS